MGGEGVEGVPIGVSEAPKGREFTIALVNWFKGERAKKMETVGLIEEKAIKAGPSKG